jgi:oligopeptide/dipeptide ABC transporter ATP-binding protein
MTQPLLQLTKVRKEFRIGGGLGIVRRTVAALDRVSLTIEGGKPTITALVGESGSGKTTIARLVMGLVEPTSGDVLYQGRSVRDWIKTDEMAYRREVQMIFQDPYSTYNPFYRVDRVLSSTVKKFKLASSKEEARRLILESMRAMGLRPEYILGRYPHQLSGGERQRLMLCRILMIKPRLIVADEPVSMLDASLRAIFLDNLLQLKDSLELSCLYITHDMNIANYVADDLVVMVHGSVMEQGEARSVIREPLHPYSQLLVASIPTPDPRKRWQDTLELKVSTLKELKPAVGCKFNPRCPHVMDVCRVKDPPLFERDGRGVACFLYDPERAR